MPSDIEPQTPAHGIDTIPGVGSSFGASTFHIVKSRSKSIPALELDAEYLQLETLNIFDV